MDLHMILYGRIYIYIPWYEEPLRSLSKSFLSKRLSSTAKTWKCCSSSCCCCCFWGSESATSDFINSIFRLTDDMKIDPFEFQWLMLTHNILRLLLYINSLYANVHLLYSLEREREREACLRGNEWEVACDYSLGVRCTE